MLTADLELMAERMACDLLYYNLMVINIMAQFDLVGGNSP